VNALKRGVHVVVGTPGRISDHLERGTLKLDSIKMLVLDEADEMLRMGFLEAVEAILQKTPAEPAGRPVHGHAAGAQSGASPKSTCVRPSSNNHPEQDRDRGAICPPSATGW